MNILYRIFVVFLTSIVLIFAQGTASPPIQHRGHNLHEVATPPVQAGDVVTRLAKTADGDFAAVYSALARRTMLYRSISGGAYKALISDSNPTFTSLSQQFTVVNNDGSIGSNNWEFGDGQIVFSTLCHTT